MINNVPMDQGLNSVENSVWQQQQWPPDEDDIKYLFTELYPVRMCLPVGWQSTRDGDNKLGSGRENNILAKSGKNCRVTFSLLFIPFTK